MLDRSAADPHCTPPIVPPRPTRVCHNTSPLLVRIERVHDAGLLARDERRRPLGSVTRIGDAPKSKSGPFESAQLVLSGSRHAAV